jgi:hypothetical protein
MVSVIVMRSMRIERRAPIFALTERPWEKRSPAITALDHSNAIPGIDQPMGLAQCVSDCGVVGVKGREVELKPIGLPSVD